MKGKLIEPKDIERLLHIYTRHEVTVPVSIRLTEENAIQLLMQLKPYDPPDNQDEGIETKTIYGFPIQIVEEGA